MTLFKAILTGAICVVAAAILALVSSRSDATAYIVVYWLLNTILCWIKYREEMAAFRKAKQEE